MVTQPQLVALLIKVAVSASIASILMRFASIQKILLRDERTIGDRLQLALIFSVLFGASAGVRALSHGQYPAIDLAMEGAVIAGMLGSKRLDGWTALYLLSALAASATGFGFPF